MKKLIAVLLVLGACSSVAEIEPKVQMTCKTKSGEGFMFTGTASEAKQMVTDLKDGKQPEPGKVKYLGATKAVKDTSKLVCDTPKPVSPLGK